MALCKPPLIPLVNMQFTCVAGRFARSVFVSHVSGGVVLRQGKAHPVSFGFGLGVRVRVRVRVRVHMCLSHSRKPRVWCNPRRVWYNSS